MYRFTFLSLATIVFLAASAGAALAADWKVGIARVDITPEKPVWMAGYAARDHLPEGTIHPLWAKALAIEDSAGSRLVVVTNDLIGMPRELGDAVCARAKQTTGIDRGRVLLNFSHTHCGPVVLACAPVAYDLTHEQRTDAEAYARTLQDKLVKLIEAASADLQPARLAYGEGKATFAINRRAGRALNNGEPVDRSALVPVDHSVPVLQVTDAQGKVAAVLFGYACHNTTTPIYQYNGDYALRLKKEFAGQRLWVASYSNSVPAYIPSERVLKEGGYEGGEAMVYFGIHGPFLPGVEDRVVGEVRRLMVRCR